MLAADVDFASLGMGTAESTFLGLRDITLAAKAMEPPAAVELRVEKLAQPGLRRREAERSVASLVKLRS